MRRILYILIIISTCEVHAQIRTQYFDKPFSALEKEQVKTLEKAAPTHIMPTIDSKTLQDAKNVMPERLGIGFDVTYTLSDGTWINDREERIWIMSIESRGALNLNFVINGLHLPEGTTLEIINAAASILYGPVDASLVRKDGYLAISLIEGDKAFFILRQPTGSIELPKLTITKVFHGFRQLDEPSLLRGYGDSDPDNVNIACHPEYNEESKTVALVFDPINSIHYSGSLVMTTDSSFKPYFLTAFHALDRDSNNVLSAAEKTIPENCEYKFYYKRKTCNGTNTYTSYSYIGATFKAAWKTTDFVLLRLWGDLKCNPYLRWLGWSRNTVAPTNGACIHHPRGDLMKISIEDDTFISKKYESSSIYNCWQVTYDEGITELGSSGSPILDQNHRVVGQLWVGDSITKKLNYHGKFNLSWNGGGTPETRLSDWLDSIGTNQMTTDLASPISLLSIDGPTVPGNGTIYTVADLFPNCTVKWTFGGTDIAYPGDTVSNFPVQNGFRFHNVRKQYVRGTLTAKVYLDGSLLTTLTKFLHSGANFSGTYEQDPVPFTNIPATGATPLQCYFPETMWRGSMITLKSNNFYGATVTHTGETPQFWIQNADSIAFQLYYNQHLPLPLTSGTNLIYPNEDFEITCTFPNNYNVYYFRIHPQNPVSHLDPYTPFALGIRPTGSSLFITLMEEIEEEDNRANTNDITIDPSGKKYIKLQGWHLTILDSLTGRVMFNGIVSRSEQEVSTDGWFPGVYIVLAQYGQWETTKKVSVNN